MEATATLIAAAVKALKEFDKNKDGKLDEAERNALRKAMSERLGSRGGDRRGGERGERSERASHERGGERRRRGGEGAERGRRGGYLAIATKSKPLTKQLKQTPGIIPAFFCVDIVTNKKHNFCC